MQIMAQIVFAGEPPPDGVTGADHRDLGTGLV